MSSTGYINALFTNSHRMFRGTELKIRGGAQNCNTRYGTAEFQEKGRVAELKAWGCRIEQKVSLACSSGPASLSSTLPNPYASLVRLKGLHVIMSMPAHFVSLTSVRVAKGVRNGRLVTTRCCGRSGKQKRYVLSSAARQSDRKSGVQGTNDLRHWSWCGMQLCVLTSGSGCCGHDCSLPGAVSVIRRA